MSSNLRTRLIRLAHANPALRADILPLLKRAGCENLPEGGMRDNCEKKVEEGKANAKKDEKDEKAAKKAAQDSGDFARWAIANREPLDESEIRNRVKNDFGLEITPTKPKREGARFWVGDQVQINKAKHKDAETKDVYEQFHGKIGVVTDADATGVAVKFKSGGEGVFPDAQKPRGVGILKYNPPFVMEGSPKMEIVYLAKSGSVPDAQEIIVTKYLAGGKSEQRSGNYFSGYAFSAHTNKANQVYFSLSTQQRIEVDPEMEGGYLPRSFNPTDGQVVYMGKLGKRPNGWDEAWAAQQAQAQAAPQAQAHQASLRAKLIRLAHARPSLRADLLPLLTGRSR